MPEPAKLSRIMEFLLVASFIQNSIKFCGFGKVKFEIPIFSISPVPLSFVKLEFIKSNDVAIKFSFLLTITFVPTWNSLSI